MTSTPNPIHREDAIWLAGLIDGEGCFDSPSGNPRLRIKMGDQDVILRAAHIMNASTYIERAYRPNHSDMLVVQLTGDRAVEVMRSVLPWLGARRTAKATELIMAQAAKKLARKVIRAVA